MKLNVGFVNQINVLHTSVLLLSFIPPAMHFVVHMLSRLHCSLLPPLYNHTDQLHLIFTVSPRERENPVNLTCLSERCSRWIWTQRVQHTAGESGLRGKLVPLVHVCQNIVLYSCDSSEHILVFFIQWCAVKTIAAKLKMLGFSKSKTMS